MRPPGAGGALGARLQDSSSLTEGCGTAVCMGSSTGSCATTDRACCDN